jgi:hypothetical protein
MALPILDGNQSATTLSSILTSGEHIPAHTVVSLGTQAITDMRSAVSGSVVSISNFPATQPVSIASVTIGNTVTIAGTVTANLSAIYVGEAPFSQADKPMMAVGGLLNGFDEIRPIRIDLNTGGQIVAGTVTANLAPQANGPVIEIDSPIPNDPKYATIVGGFDTDSGDTRALRLGGSGGIIVQELPPISGTVTIGNSVTIASLPAISGTVTANLSISSTVITSGSFSSLSSATLVPANPARKMATVYNLGAGQLFVNAGVTATTLGGGFMVALSSGDFYECDYTTTTLSAIFATAGTASWMSH